MAAVLVKVKARPPAGKFRRGPLELTDRWKPVDVSRPDVREQLVESVGVHVLIHPLDVQHLAEVGLELKAGRLAEVKPKKEPRKSAA
jgi:hypothetical protein